MRAASSWPRPATPSRRPRRWEGREAAQRRAPLRAGNVAEVVVTGDQMVAFSAVCGPQRAGRPYRAARVARHPRRRSRCRSAPGARRSHRRDRKLWRRFDEIRAWAAEQHWGGRRSRAWTLILGAGGAAVAPPAFSVVAGAVVAIQAMRAIPAEAASCPYANSPGTTKKCAQPVGEYERFVCGSQ
jgi:hypothetical protein